MAIKVIYPLWPYNIEVVEVETQYKPKVYFHTEFGPQFMKEVEETIKKELGYTDEELEGLEVLTWDDLVADYENYVKELIGGEAWERLGPYIDVEAMIKDDITSGWITELKAGSWKLYLRER